MTVSGKLFSMVNMHKTITLYNFYQGSHERVTDIIHCKLRNGKRGEKKRKKGREEISFFCGYLTNWFSVIHKGKHKSPHNIGLIR